MSGDEKQYKGKREYFNIRMLSEALVRPEHFINIR